MAATESKPQPQRKWVPATVGICHWQTATDRFGAEAKAVIRDRERIDVGLHALGNEAPFPWTPEPFIQLSGNLDAFYHTVPATQLYRNNLTALSQPYNLYFVAYQSYIFVYVPRSIARQRLPRHPDCRLHCDPSSVARYIGGYVDGIIPHSINNIMTGYLGNEEIVLACCDDGEVYAYYTKEIAEWISSQDKSPLARPSGLRRPKYPSTKLPSHFFRENVGLTAWGLAIHQQSRLIAVSSNRREVTVFACALNGDVDDQDRVQTPKREEGTEHMDRETLVRLRERNWRIVLALGQRVSNVPNISFLDDEDGEAEKVAAVDLDGFAWIAHIWSTGQPVVCVEPIISPLRRSEENFGELSRGWGILALPDESFLRVDTLEELIGGKVQGIARADRVCSQPMANIEPCVQAIPDNPCPIIRPGGYGPNQHTFFPGNDPLDPIENSPSTAPGPANHDSDDDDVLSDADSEGGEGSEDEGDFDELDQDEASEDYDDDMDDESDVSWAGDEFIEEAVVGSSWSEASTQTDPNAPNAAQQTVNFQPGSLLGTANVEPESAMANLVAAANPLSILHNVTQDRRLSKTNEPAEILHWPRMDANMVYFPHSGRIAPVPHETRQLARFLKRPHETTNSLRETLVSVSKRYHFLRMYEKDLEMRSLGKEHLKEVGIHCPNVLWFGDFFDRTLRHLFRATSRMSLVMHVPELSLVVIGSPMGRVLLLTPTRLSTRLSVEDGSGGYWSHGLRVEWVLPRASDDICHGKQRRPLHGIAIGPVQDQRGVDAQVSDRASTPRRYRLMLHYRNHDIATFEITREEQTGKLCIF